MMRLTFRLDALAALRRLPEDRTPDLHAAAHAALLGGADAVRLRAAWEQDAERLAAGLPGPLHLDVVAGTAEVEVAARLLPERATLVPPPTSGAAAKAKPADRGAWSQAIERLRGAGVPVGVRLAPTEEALLAASEAGAQWADLDTHAFAHARTEGLRVREFLALRKAAATARQLGLRVTLGGGLGPAQAGRLSLIPEVEEIHLGFQVLARALFTGLTAALAAARTEVLSARALASAGTGDSA